MPNNPIAAGLARLLADTYAVYLKTHGYHWNVRGPAFASLHTLFMTQYTEMWTAIDEIAERIRALGELAPQGYGGSGRWGSWRPRAMAPSATSPASATGIPRRTPRRC